ncbi:DUF1611 domain-containing protein [Pacificimonas sp. WHA3]|uniref:DUF1611 domain-containing protein n=1 Tax=Pacificimonas pallii TaxID=2827236 RepID=A0ABS6SFE8_9SPHN|nr:DUF1611 domain-containing protein [Pacificimonas pallii]MBV7257135.1 DUF1611 domain-containing protein [Pacificimonas pallii]
MNISSTGLTKYPALPQPYLLFLGDVDQTGYAKTAFGLAQWADDKCIGEYSFNKSGLTTGLPRMTPTEAARAGAKSLVIGVANQGGRISAAWIPSLVDALKAGLSIISGLHIPLSSIPELAQASRDTGGALIDIRRPPSDIPVGTGRKRSGRRLLTVGTDCALGKKYTALAIHRAFAERNVNADFRATGQTGIMIAGGGIPMDAVVSDFEAGAAEILSPDAPADHWDVIEGQGSLFNPAYAAVSLGLLHGSQPDVFVVCHDPSRSRMLGLEDYAVPSIEEVIDLTSQLGRLTNPDIRCAGVSLNTSSMDSKAATRLMARESDRLVGLPVADPIRGGPQFERLVTNCLL